MQHRFGEMPSAAPDRGETGGWLGIREDRPIDALAIAVLADAWFPAPWPRLAELAPAPTIDLTIHFRSPLPVEGPLLLGQFTQPPRARRLLRGGRAALGARRHPGRPVAPARPAAGREDAVGQGRGLDPPMGRDGGYTRKQRVVLETARHTISGEVVLPLEGLRTRLSDLLNTEGLSFISIVDAEIGRSKAARP